MMNKTDWYMLLCDVISKRSKDPHSQFGCVAVSDDGAILSVGYNGPPREVNDTLVPLTRPEKYIYFEHSERNCIYNAAKHGVCLDNCVFYVNGIPCNDCMRAMYQVGARAVVCKDKLAHKYDDRDTLKDFLLAHSRRNFTVKVI